MSSRTGTWKLTGALCAAMLLGAFQAGAQTGPSPMRQQTMTEAERERAAPPEATPPMEARPPAEASPTAPDPEPPATGEPTGAVPPEQGRTLGKRPAAPSQRPTDGKGGSGQAAGTQEIEGAGPDGVFGTADDPSLQGTPGVPSAGPDGIFGTADDVRSSGTPGTGAGIGAPAGERPQGTQPPPVEPAPPETTSPAPAPAPGTAQPGQPDPAGPPGTGGAGEDPGITGETQAQPDVAAPEQQPEPQAIEAPADRPAGGIAAEEEEEEVDQFDTLDGVSTPAEDFDSLDGVGRPLPENP